MVSAKKQKSNGTLLAMIGIERNTAKRATQYLRDKAFPFSLESLWYSMVFVAILQSVHSQPIAFLIANLEHYVLLNVLQVGILCRFLSVLITTSCLWTSVVWSVRRLITLTLMYKGYLFEAPGKMSLPTKLFMGFIQVLWKFRPTFFTFQDLLPTRPLPTISETIDRYLASMKPLLSTEEYEKLEQKSQEFQTAEAPQLQRKLWLKWLTTPNYVSDWWKEYAYMKSDDSLLGSSCAGLDVVLEHRTHRQAARAATLIILKQQFLKEAITKQTMKPISLGGIPLCAQQYADQFRSIRLPGLDGDKMVDLDKKANHVAIYHGGCYYAVPIYVGKRLARPAELESCLQEIIDSNDQPCSGEVRLGALTASNRKHWAKVRKEHFSQGVNKQSLNTLENALDVFVLDDIDYEYDPDTTKLEHWYRQGLLGDGHKLWLDHTSTTIVSRNGKFVSSGEHSVVDALIYSHIIEYWKYHESFNPAYTYKHDGHARGIIEHTPKAYRLTWKLNEQCCQEIERSFSTAQEMMKDLDNAAIIYRGYGKNFMKKVGLSPDAFIQMALQLTYYKDQSKFPLTYESAMTRLFKNGRTETIRSATDQSCKFVRAMTDPESLNSDRTELLRAACDAHQKNVRQAMIGEACDRHIFALYIVSKYLKLDSPFLTQAMSRGWDMSTSQTPQNQQAEYMATLNKAPTLLFPAGSFAAPSSSLYGVCYTVGSCGELVSFHVAAHADNPQTDAKRFRDEIVHSLLAMRAIFDDLPPRSK